MSAVLIFPEWEILPSNPLNFRVFPRFFPCEKYAKTLAGTVFSEYLVSEFNQIPNTHET
jgi:hypothetical protein